VNLEIRDVFGVFAVVRGRGVRGNFAGLNAGISVRWQT
jgi:hypothetical protein